MTAREGLVLQKLQMIVLTLIIASVHGLGFLLFSLFFLLFSLPILAEKVLKEVQFLIGYLLGMIHRRVQLPDVSPLLCWERNSLKMSILFQFALIGLVLMSFAMVIGVPVAYASPQNWDQSKRLILLGSFVWVALVLLVGGLNYLVV